MEHLGIPRCMGSNWQTHYELKPNQVRARCPWCQNRVVVLRDDRRYARTGRLIEHDMNGLQSSTHWASER